MRHICMMLAVIFAVSVAASYKRWSVFRDALVGHVGVALGGHDW